MPGPAFTGDKQAYVQAIMETCPPRCATVNEARKLITFDRSVFPDDYGRIDPVAPDIESYPRSNEVIEIDGEFVAHVRGKMFPSDNFPGRRYGYIHTLAIAKGFQERGLGGLMLGRMIDTMKEENPTGIFVETRVSNIRMQELLKKFGFVVWELLPKLYVLTHNPEDGYCMVWQNTAPAPEV